MKNGNKNKIEFRALKFYFPCLQEAKLTYFIFRGFFSNFQISLKWDNLLIFKSTTTYKLSKFSVSQSTSKKSMYLFILNRLGVFTVFRILISRGLNSGYKNINVPYAKSTNKMWSNTFLIFKIAWFLRKLWPFEFIWVSMGFCRKTHRK